MKCEGPGSFRREAGYRASRSDVYKTTCCYELRTSKKAKALYIRTLDYHPGTLELTAKDLEDILKRFQAGR